MFDFCIFERLLLHFSFVATFLFLTAHVFLATSLRRASLSQEAMYGWLVVSNKCLVSDPKGASPSL